MCLNLVPISLVPTSKVLCRVLITLHSPKHPVEYRFAKPTAIRIAECTTMADWNVSFPRRNTSSEILEVAFAL
jgi:hypothetical protein